MHEIFLKLLASAANDTIIDGFPFANRFVSFEKKNSCLKIGLEFQKKTPDLLQRLNHIVLFFCFFVHF